LWIFFIFLIHKFTLLKWQSYDSIDLCDLVWQSICFYPPALIFLCSCPDISMLVSICFFARNIFYVYVCIFICSCSYVLCSNLFYTCVHMFLYLCLYISMLEKIYMLLYVCFYDRARMILCSNIFYPYISILMSVCFYAPVSMFLCSFPYISMLEHILCSCPYIFMLGKFWIKNSENIFAMELKLCIKRSRILWWKPFVSLIFEWRIIAKILKEKGEFACMRQVGDVGIEGLLVGMVHVAEVVQEASWVCRGFQLLYEALGS